MKLGSFNTVTDASGYHIPLVKPNQENAKISEEDFVNSLPSSPTAVITSQADYDTAVAKGIYSFIWDTNATIYVNSNFRHFIKSYRTVSVQVDSNFRLDSSLIESINIKFTDPMGSLNNAYINNSIFNGAYLAPQNKAKFISFSNCQLGSCDFQTENIFFYQTAVKRFFVFAENVNLSNSDIGVYGNFTLNPTTTIDNSRIFDVQNGEFNSIDYKGKSVLWDGQGNPFELNKTAL